MDTFLRKLTLKQLQLLQRLYQPPGRTQSEGLYYSERRGIERTCGALRMAGIVKWTAPLSHDYRGHSGRSRSGPTPVIVSLTKDGQRLVAMRRTIIDELIDKKSRKLEARWQRHLERRRARRAAREPAG